MAVIRICRFESFPDSRSVLFPVWLLRNGIFSYLCRLNEKLLFEVNVKSSFLTGEGSATAICVCDSGDGGCGKGRTGLARQHRANV